MKKVMLWGVGMLFALLVTVIAINVNLKFGETYNNDVCLHNVEALAQGESGGEECVGSGSIICFGGLYKVRVSGR